MTKKITAKFKKGDIVRKVKGAKFWGKVVAVYNTAERGEDPYWHYDVMAVHPDFAGTIHIMVESQLELYQ